MEIKRIVVCGDSCCSAVTEPRWYGHFSDLLAEAGYEIISLARGGITNTAICFQLEQAIKLNANLVIFNTTDPSRLDIPRGKFERNRGLKNFIYPFKTDSSTGSPYVGDLSAPIYSNLIPAILTPRPDDPIRLPTHILEAVKKYITTLQDITLEEIKSSWMIAHWRHQLEKANIPYIEITKKGIGKEIYQYIKNNLTKINQCGYHTDKETQRIVADSIIQEIEKWNQTGRNA